MSWKPFWWGLAFLVVVFGLVFLWGIWPAPVPHEVRPGRYQLGGE